MNNQLEAASSEKNARNLGPKRTGKIWLSKRMKDIDGARGNKAAERNCGKDATSPVRFGRHIEAAQVRHRQVSSVGQAQAESRRHDAYPRHGEHEPTQLKNRWAGDGGGDDARHKGNCAEYAEAT